MPTLRLHLLSASVFLALGLAASAQAQSLVQLYDSARAYDATYKAALAQAQANRALADQSKALLLPTVGLGGSYTHCTTDVANNPSCPLTGTQSGVGLQANIPLFNAANFKERQKAKKSTELVDIQLHVAEQDLMVRTAQAYFDLLAAQDALKLAQSQKEAMKQQLEFAKRNFEVGTATITDSREAQAGADLAAAQESAAIYAVQTKYSALAQLVGKEAIAPWTLKTPFTTPDLENNTLPYWLDLAEKSDAVKAGRVQYEMAKLETDAARAGHLPTVTGTLSRNIGRASTGLPPPLPGQISSHATTASINVNIPLFAGFAIQNQVKEKLALQDKAQDDLDATERNMAQNTREAFFGVQSLKAQVGALEAAEKSSQSSLEANKLGYEVGVRINIDVLNAQTQLYDTQSKLAKARYDLLTTQLKLKQAVGVLSAADLDKVNSYLTPDTPKAASNPEAKKAEKAAAANAKEAAKEGSKDGAKDATKLTPSTELKKSSRKALRKAAPQKAVPAAPAPASSASAAATA